MRRGLALFLTLVPIALGAPAAAKAPQSAEPEIVTIASGTLELKGLLWRPRSSDPAPIVLFHHGGGCADVPDAARALGPRFAARGYAFLWLYRRGAGLSRGQGECAFEQIPRVRAEKGADAAFDLQLQLMTTTELDDAMAGLVAVRKLPGIDPNRVIVAGHSFGAQLAMLSAERDATVLAAMGFSGAAAVWDRAPKIRNRLMQAAGALRVPIYLGYAEDDNATPGRELGAELARLGKPHHLGIYAIGGHNFVFRAEHPAHSQIFEFLARVAQSGHKPILFDSDRTGRLEIYALDADASAPPRQLTNTAGARASSSFAARSPDGRRIAFMLTVDGNADIAVMEADGSGVTRLTTHPSADAYPAWSPDGRRIAFVASRDGNREIYVMEADGSNQRNVSQHPAFDSRPAWSPDGKQILFGSDRDQTGRLVPNLHVMREDGTDVRRLTSHARADMAARYSPDGGSIVFASNRGGSQQVYQMSADGSSVRQLTEGPAINGGPDWSPDGRRIVFNSERDGNAEIYVMAADGSSARRLTSHPALDVHPSW